MAQLKTVQDSLKLLSSGSNLNSVTSASTVNISTTPPASSASIAVIPNTSLSYLKIVPMATSAALASLSMKVTGWSKATDGTNTWYVPVTLFEGTVSGAGPTTSINSATLCLATGITKTSGDGKLYTNANGSFVLIDAMGCQFIRVEFSGTAGTGSVNAFVGGI